MRLYFIVAACRNGGQRHDGELAWIDGFEDSALSFSACVCRLGSMARD